MTAPARPSAFPVVFHAPLKPPDHPTPSGDRTVARLFLQVLDRIGFMPWLAREPRTRDGQGDAQAQARLIERAEREAARLIDHFRDLPSLGRPRLWFTYHVYYKAPDLIGPVVSRALGIPYVIAEASRSPKRLHGPWARFAALAEAAIDQARLVLCPTQRDFPALAAAKPPGQRLLLVPPFLGLPPAPDRPPRAEGDPVRLVTVAMTRPGAKMDSYRLLAEALGRIDPATWTLTVIGGGEAEVETHRLFQPFREQVRFLGALPPDEIPPHLAEADLFVWPGLDEAFGMVYLEAQAQSLPVLACDGPGVRAVVASAAGHPLPAPTPEAFAGTLGQILATPDTLRGLGRDARERIARNHSLDAAAEQLAPVLRPLAEGGRR
ncbi:MAG: glycosyltransferase [Rhodospirillum sp.]|nr:glycosyltransferase [Rhodospirillum sp.]